MSCKTINIDLTNVPPVPIQIGVAGENSFRTITFDASKWGADYPDATYTVVYRRSDGYLYPVLVNASADAIVWNPTGTDTAVSGNGQLEVRLLDGETIGKTIIMQTYVAPALSGDESEPSTPAPDWVNDVADDADRAEEAASHYPKIVNGVWHVWSVSDEDFVSTGIDAQGEDGYSPTVTVTEIEGGHRVTITDATGAHTFDVIDGQGGTGGAVDSVNGKTGTVVLDASDVGALPDDTQIPSKTSDLTNDSGFVTAQQAAAAAPVQSVNGMTGAVTIPTGSSDAVLYTPQSLTDSQKAQARTNVGAGTYSKPGGGIPASDLASAVQTSLGKADTALQTAPVQSVNGQTGAVTIPIPSVPQMATQTDMTDWTSGKTVDASAAKTVVSGKQNAPLEIPITTSDGGESYTTTVTAAQIRAAKENAVFVFDTLRIDATAWLPGFIDTNTDMLVGVLDSDLRIQIVVSLANDSVSVAVQMSQRQSIPTKVSELTNDSGYQTASDVQTAIAGKANAADVYTKTEVDQKLVGAMDYKGAKATVSELPTSGNATGDVWHITADGSEWAWNGSTWEELGSAVDLSGYATEQWVKDKGYLTQHQSLAAYRTSAAQDTIDAAQDTAIAAKYTKPSTGIPKTDLASDVKASLGKADTALQEHQSLASYRTASAQDEIDNAQNVEIRKKANSADLAAVAKSGSYNDLADKPSIPSLAGYATEAWVNNKGYLTLADLPVYNGGVS